jgi:hypothetical protein
VDSALCPESKMDFFLIPTDSARTLDLTSLFSVSNQAWAANLANG